MQSSFVNKLGLGYRFDRDRETLALIYLCYFIVLLFSLVVVLIHITGEELFLVSYRYHFIIILGIVLLLLVRLKFIKLAKLLMLTMLPFILLILPLVAGIYSDEFYFWFPYVPIALSLIPHFILHTIHERKALIISLFAYLLLAIFIPGFMMHLSDGSEKIIPIVIENRFYYGFVPVIIYVFVNLALGLVFSRIYEYEQIMLRQQDELIQAEKMASLGVLTTGIAHEINNPMNFISGGIHAISTLKNELLKLDGERSKEKAEIYKQIERIMENSLEGVRRVTDIVSSLQYFANPGKANKKNHDLDKLLYAVLLNLEKAIPYNITLTRNIPQGTIVYCYDEQLQQVFLHILQNAIDVLEESREDRQKNIVISASKITKEKDEFTCISFSNNGPPIPEQEIKRIYDPFYTVNNAGKGKGLGMAISYMIIREHKGWIEARNEQNRVIFDIILPKASASKPL